MNSNKLTKAEEEFYFCQYGVGGGFMTNLFNTIMKADSNNQAKLSLGFPEEVRVVQRYQLEEGYWESIQKAMNTTNA